MAPAANHKVNQEAMDDTFSLTNMSPQVGCLAAGCSGGAGPWLCQPAKPPPHSLSLFPHCQVGAGFNRDYWARFERFIQDVTRKCDNVWVVTGPLYLPQRVPGGADGFVMQHRMIGESHSAAQCLKHPGNQAYRSLSCLAPEHAGRHAFAMS